MTSEPRIGLIGLGVMATRMLTNIGNHGGFARHAAWDPDPDARARAREAFPDLAVRDDAGAVIGDADTDIVYIATPPAHHREYALAAADAGKKVFSEKPLGVDVAESRQLVERFDADGIANAVNFTFSGAPAVEVIEAALADGTIGEVAAVDIRLHFCRWPRDWQVPAAWLSERAQGGFVRETFSHYAYLMERLFGRARLVSAHCRYPDGGVAAETHALAMMDCGGLPVTFAGGTGGLGNSGADRVDFTIWGRRATYRLYDWNRLRVSTGDGWEERLTDIADPRQEGYRRQLLNLGRFAAGEPQRMATFADARSVQELVEAILAA